MAYEKTIDDFDDLVDLQTLARCCFGPEPSAFVLRAIVIKEKSECYRTSLFFPSPSFYLFYYFLSVSLLLFCRDDDQI